VLTFVGPVQVNVAYNPYSRPRGAVFYDAPVSLGQGEEPLAPLYCVTPGNGLPVTVVNGVLEQDEGRCLDNFLPVQPRSFLRRLTFTFSIGPDF
jgi:hypothetical protein